MDLKQLKVDLVRDEGLRLAAYKDTNGFWTIGVGHLLGPDTGDGPRMRFITKREAMALLDLDIEDAIAGVDAVFPEANLSGNFPIDDVRARALVNMAFNRGETNMRKSTTITPAIKAAIKGEGRWEAVSVAILTSPWGKQIGRRAERLAHAFALGKDMT